MSRQVNGRTTTATSVRDRFLLRVPWKCWLLFGDKDCLEMWNASIPAVNKYLADDTGVELWYGHADMPDGPADRKNLRRARAFFPAVLALSVTSRAQGACKRHPSRCGTCMGSSRKSSITNDARRGDHYLCDRRLLNPPIISITTPRMGRIGNGRDDP